MRGLRKRIKGWSANLDAERRKNMKFFMRELDELDSKAENNHLTEREIKRKKELVGLMDHIWRVEEIRARQRARESDIKEGDRNTSYFFTKANQGKRKKNITFLEEDVVVYEENERMLEHASTF
jgi:hypothetical protein